MTAARAAPRHTTLQLRAYAESVERTKRLRPPSTVRVLPRHDVVAGSSARRSCSIAASPTTPIELTCALILADMLGTAVLVEEPPPAG
jgi:hypothetical protein